jgi:thiamine kinase-like enzyme
MLEELIAKPDELEQFAKLFAELHVKMHSIKIGGLPSQRQRLEEKIRNAKPLSEKRKNAALNTLRQLADDNVLCHGDFHPDNILMSTQGPIVIDWNDATLGNPHADIARTLLLLNPNKDLIVDYLTQKLGHQTKYDIEQIQASLNLFTDTYLKQYSQSCTISIDDIESWRLPVTAARLSEGIKEEESRLASIVETLSRVCS